MQLPPDLTAIHKLRALRVIDGKHLNANRRNQAVLNYILEVETQAGSYFLRSHGALYMFLGFTRRILRLTFKHPGEDFAAYLHNMYGVSESSPLGKAVYSHLHNHAVNNAVNAELRRFAVYDTKQLVTYLSTYDGQMWRIDGGTPERVTNGEDDVFFIDDDGGVTVEPDIGPHGILLDKLVDLNYTPGIGGITAEQQRMALTVWIFALAFPDLMPTKPLLMLEGTQGSGKSASVQLLQMALLGISRPMILSRNGEADFGVMLLRSPIAVFDNTDSYIDWIPDAVCAYTTTGMWVKRKLYTDSDETTIRPHAFVAVASKNPASFRREDVTDRQIIIRLDRRDTFKPFEALRDEIMTQRPQLMGEYLWYVNEIVDYLRVNHDVVAEAETTRMADFAAFTRAVGAVLHWTKKDVTDLMTALASERDAFVCEEDPLVELLHKWIVYRGGGVSSIGRQVTLFELYNEINGIAQASGIMFYKSARQLAQKIRSPHVARDFDIEIPIVDRQKVYRIWRKTDPHLTALDGGLGLELVPR
jgi:hypothetical protein